MPETQPPYLLSNCIQPHELKAIKENQIVTVKIHWILGRVKHAIDCYLCSLFFKSSSAADHLSFKELEAIQKDRTVTIRARDIVYKIWHISECKICQQMLRAIGLFD